MFTMYARRTCCLWILLAAFSGVALAQDGPEDPGGPGGPPGGPPGEPPSYSWGLGVAGLAQQQAYTGIDPFFIALPILYFQNRWVELMVPRLDLKAPSIKWNDEQELTLGLGAQLVGFNGYKPGDASILSGMARRRSGIFAGPFVKWSTPLVNLSAEWMLDCSDNSTGQRLTCGFERSWFVGKRLMLTPGAAATLLDRKYADYYFGVRETEARAGRPAYSVGRSAQVDFSLRCNWLLDMKQAVIVVLQGTAYDDAVQDSPLVDRSGEAMAIVGYLYRFR